MTHAEMDELYELYVLGVLEPELSAEIEEHLNRQCSYCLQHVQGAVQFAAAMAGMADQKQPPGRLRERIVAIPKPVERRGSGNWAFAAALLAACFGLAIALLWVASELSHARSELAVIRGERNQLRTALEMMSRSDTRTVQFGRSNNVPHGRVFVNGNGGLVFVASRLPQLAADRAFELWLVPRQGNPQPAGVFRPNAAGDSVRISSARVDPAQTKAVAVSVEPQEGSSAPTSTPILVVPLE